jgi:glycosyltransferase involved in cell wall biosynthesis
MVGQDMKLCYFISAYPTVSHTFIRREIAELEANSENDITVLRVSLRRYAYRPGRNGRDVVHPADLSERERTRYILDEGALNFVYALAFALIHRPAALFSAVCGALRMMRRSHRPMVFHFAYLMEALVLARWALQQRVDHLHAHFGTNGTEVVMLAHLVSGIPYSFTVHGPDEFDRPEYLGLSEKVKHAAFVCAISSFTISQICRWIPAAEWRKIKLVRCGLDAAFWLPCAPVKPSNSQLVSVGRLCEQKGYLILIDALAALSREGIRFDMTIVGDGPLRPELEQRIRELGLEGRVVITGWLSDTEVRERIVGARALILPSFAEGLPVVLMEAAALSRPVIATYVAGIPELVLDRASGWLVPAGNVGRLRDAMRECLGAPDSGIRAMGEAARHRALEMHDIVRECRKLAGLFHGDDTAAPSPADPTCITPVDEALSVEPATFIGVDATTVGGGLCGPSRSPMHAAARADD